MPIVQVTNDEVEKVRDIAKLRSFSQAAGLIAGLNDEQWENAQRKMARWDEVWRSDVNLGGRIQVKPQATRDRLTGEMRLLLGLVESPGSDLWVTEFSKTEAVL